MPDVVYTADGIVFEWNEEKSESNKVKHDVDFRVAALIFAGPTVDLGVDKHADGEMRVLTVGVVMGVTYIAVVNVDREDHIRIISARKADRKERTLYDKEIYGGSFH